MAVGSTVTKPSQKRKASSMVSDDDSDTLVFPPSPKKLEGPAKTKTSKATSPSVTPSYTVSELELLSHAEIVAYALSLQKQLAASKKSPSTQSQELSPEDLGKKVEHLRTLMVRQIKKAMTWKPSCKTGSATFSQDFVVQNPQIIKKLFAGVIKDNGKDWKIKKISSEDFEDAIGDIDASVRYDRLELTSDITVRWDVENSTMKCSGKYGKPGTGRLAMVIAAADSYVLQ
ncbi:hypothetical protein P7C71_g2559, partial [Lecanoromycetidae sp. Uapishka_2]